QPAALEAGIDERLLRREEPELAHAIEPDQARLGEVGGRFEVGHAADDLSGVAEAAYPGTDRQQVRKKLLRRISDRGNDAQAGDDAATLVLSQDCGLSVLLHLGIDKRDEIAHRDGLPGNVGQRNLQCLLELERILDKAKRVEAQRGERPIEVESLKLDSEAVLEYGPHGLDQFHVEVLTHVHRK